MGYSQWDCKELDTTEPLIHTPMPDILGLLWWISPLHGSYWLALRTFILEERSYCLFQRVLTLLGGLPSSGQLVIHVLTLTINMNFPLKLLKLNQGNKKKFSQNFMGWILVINII